MFTAHGMTNDSNLAHKGYEYLNCRALMKYGKEVSGIAEGLVDPPVQVPGPGTEWIKV